MPINRSSFVRTSAVLLVVGALALLAIVVATILLVERNETYFDEVVEARDARTATVDLRALLQDVEVGQRGFLLTGNERYLEPYTAARGRIVQAYERMAQVLSPYPQADAPMQRLRLMIDEKLTELDRTIELAREGRQDEAVEIVSSDRGKELMDEARTLFEAVIRAADERLINGIQEQRDNIVLLRVVTLLGGLVILVVVGGAVWMALSYTRELLSARLELEELNQGLEERVNERTIELMRANEEVQRFAYIVTHDLRAPLVNIMGFTSELDETMRSIQAYVLADGGTLGEQEIKDARLAASEDLPEAIGFIRSSTKKMDGLINAILKISREGQRQLRPEKVDLQTMLEATASAVQHQLSEADGEIALDIDVPSVVADRLSMEQAVGNLIDNAIKYRSTDRPLRIDVSVKALPGRRVAIAIADNGRGIASSDHQRVFDLFRRAGQQDQPGDGIGLAHVRTLLRNMGGDITLESEYGVGTTFTIVLPADIRTVKRSVQS